MRSPALPSFLFFIISSLIKYSIRYSRFFVINNVLLSLVYRSIVFQHTCLLGFVSFAIFFLQQNFIFKNRFYTTIVINGPLVIFPVLFTGEF